MMRLPQPTRNPIYFIAEIGGNHEGDFNYAVRLTELAIESGADAVKYQIYTGDTLVSRIEGPDRNKHFKKFELSRGNYLKLADMCRQAGVAFMASVWDMGALEWADPHIDIHKIGSGDITAWPLIRWMVGTGKSLILSTGLCTIDEIRRTVEFVRRLDPSYITDRKLALLQCTTAYPCPDEDANLSAMSVLAREFGLPVGYSDHTIGDDAAFAAAVLGAEILEMHFTDQREGKTFRDHKVSITRDETRALLERIRRARSFMGSGRKEPTRSEIEAGHLVSFRRSVYAARSIAKGETLTANNMTVLRPDHGIPAWRFDELVGRTAARDMEPHEVFTEDDVT
jgi:N,N'-diacetyllegionaminate synthase